MRSIWYGFLCICEQGKSTTSLRSCLLKPVIKRLFIASTINCILLSSTARALESRNKKSKTHWKKEIIWSSLRAVLSTRNSRFVNMLVSMDRWRLLGTDSGQSDPGLDVAPSSSSHASTEGEEDSEDPGSGWLFSATNITKG